MASQRRKDFVQLINDLTNHEGGLLSQGRDIIVLLNDPKLNAVNLLNWLHGKGYTDISLEECERLLENREGLVKDGTIVQNQVKNSSY